MQRLQFCCKKFKNNHAIGFYNIKQENTLEMVLCLRGGGKKGRATALGAKDDNNKQTHVENIDTKKHEWFVMLLQLKDLNFPATLHIQNLSNRSLCQGDKVIYCALQRISRA